MPLEADYVVTSASNTGVALCLSKATNRRVAKSLGEDGSRIFELPNRFAAKPMLRLFLQSIGSNNTRQSPLLIGANNARDLDDATNQIEQKGVAGCSAASPAEIECVSFGTETAVNLLSSIGVNGKLEHRPFGTTVGYLLGLLSAPAQARALETISLRRPLIRGGYAEVKFSKTTEAVQQIILLPGDTLAWKQ